MVSPTLGPKSPSQYMDVPSLPSIPSIPAIPIPPSRYPIAADSYHPHYSSSANSLPSPPFTDSSSSHGMISQSPKTDDSLSYTPASESFNTYPLYNWSYKQHQPQPSPLPPLSYYYRPHRLEDVAPRDTISLIIALFFDFVYPLTPCVHKPSFMADLHARREERDPLFFALVMSTVASTLVQVPRSYLPMERPVVRKLAQVR